jgi:hypothetical protein
MTIYKFAVGMVLTLAMIAVLAFAALVFSARDFQFGVAQLSPATNGLISFARLAEVETQIAKIEEDSSGPRGEQLEIDRQLAALGARSSDVSADADEARAAMVGAIAAIEQRASAAQAASAAADTSAEGLSLRVNTLAARPGLAPAEQQSIASLRAQAEQLAAQEASLSETDSERAALVTRQRLVGGQVSEANRRIYALQQSVVPEYQHFARVRGEANALAALSPLGVSAFLAQGHPALLSTTLVLLMGALGALLYLFPAYLNRAVPVTMAEIAVRLIFGMCAAMALYVLANAAISSFSLGGGGSQPAGTSAALNPFTVSLFGIVAGVMSEDIAKWIQDRGRGIFQQGGAANAAGVPDQGTAINPHGGPNAP